MEMNAHKNCTVEDAILDLISDLIEVIKNDLHSGIVSERTPTHRCNMLKLLLETLEITRHKDF